MRVLVVDDDQLVAISLQTILEASGDIEVVAIGNDGSDAIKLYEEHKPDVLLMDIQMKQVTGLEAAEAIIKEDKNAKILLLTTFSDEEYIVKALNIGEKEMEIIAQVAMGKSNKEIADTLFLSEGTVRNYISVILEKLALRDRTQLAVFYLTKGGK